jgi:RNA polymerase sigma factor (sigma-70 family)
MSTLQPLSPTELVQLALREYEGALVGHAYNILRDLDLARDAVQDAFLRLYQQPEGKVPAATLKAWMFTVTGNRCIDMLRKRKRLVSLDSMENPDIAVEDDSAADREPATDAPEAEQVLRYLKRLPQNQQEVVRLKFQGGLSYKEISEATGLTVSNVGFLLHAAIKRLRSLLGAAIHPAA